MIDSDIIARLYAIALGKNDWASVLDDLRRRFGADAGVLMTFAADDGAPSCQCMSGYDQSVWRRYAEHYAAVDPLAWAVQDGRLPNGQVLADHQLIHPRLMRRTEFYNGFWRPLGIDHVASGLTVDRDGAKVTLLLTRGRSAGPFTPAQLVTLQDYFRHVAQAHALEREVAARSAEADLDAAACRYGLTTAEVDVVRRLAECGSLRLVARRLGRSYNTVRAHLRSIFSKTGTHSQAALLSLIHRPPAD